ncbi:dnaJ homolog subfamily C member 21 [Bacillus rossius redtenbacheri]|uniref:dnaJ homolog subfamily C member 21 n=1 Tax=Bacillus rossius redtenbacheri TaxID=93214 RepID=UPI002FDE6427
MFWILKHSRLGAAASFFHAVINNNNTTAAGSTASAGGRPGRQQGYYKLRSAEEASDLNANTQRGQSDSDSTCSDHRQPHSEHSERTERTERTDSDCDEALTCNVCDQSFNTAKMLINHQQKKRHFGCSACDSLFPSLMALEHHKEEFDHWSGDESLGDHSESDHDEYSDGMATSEEMERLL